MVLRSEDVSDDLVGELFEGGQAVFEGFCHLLAFLSGSKSDFRAWFLTVVVVFVFSICLNVSCDDDYIS